LRISDRSIEEVREAANIVEVASEFTALRRQGARFVGLCPYPDHSENTPSFSVTPDRGFYYCFGCLEANERIWTSRGLLPIAATEVGDKVIGLDGRRETITDKWFKSGPTLRIRTGAAKEGIELTPDHWCIFVRREEALRALRATSRVHLTYSGREEMRFSSKLRRKYSNAQLSVAHASDVRDGDFWLYPVIPDEDRDDVPLHSEHVIKPFTKSPQTDRIVKLPVNSSTAWLYGVWLAEGSLYRGGVKWSFAVHEAESFAKRVMLVLGEEFGRASTSYVRLDQNICQVTCSSTDLAALFGHWFGRGAHKRVPVEALNWTAECQAALIEGYVDGDGSTSNGLTSAATMSEELAYGIFALCIQAGKNSSLSSIPPQTGTDGMKGGRTYYIHILTRESMKGFFAEIGGTRFFWSAVQAIETFQDAPKTVVDITTTGSHTFLTKMGITHNCQRGGDAIKLVSELKSFSFVDAVSYLAERSGVDLEFKGVADPEGARERNDRRRATHKALAAAAVYYHKYLLKSRSPEAENARRYLTGRGLERSTIEEFRLGYAPPRGVGGFVGAAARLGLSRKTLDSVGLLSARGGERFSGRITFPISDRRGRIVGFGARALGDGHPKYLNSPETELFNKRDLLYGFPQVSETMRKERAALVVEGYTDVLMLYQCGVKHAVATLGTATTPAHLRTLSGYADRIYVLFDPDVAGEKAIERAAATAAELRLDLRVLRLPQDPADWLLEHPPEEFTELLEGAVPVLEYGIRRIVQRTRGTGATERSRAVPEVKNLIDEIKDPVLYREALRLASEALGLDPSLLERHRRRASAGPGASMVRADHADPHRQAGREILAVLLARPYLAAGLLRDGFRVASLPEPVVLSSETFWGETQARIFSLLREHAGEEFQDVVVDERARPFMDQLGALASRAEEIRRQDLYLSDKSVREAFLRLVILGRQRDKREAADYDEKERLRIEVRALKDSLRAVSAEP
jgi:DNA primase